MSLPLTRPGALLIAARRPDPGNCRLIAAVSVGDPAAAQRAGERLERCDGLIFVITVPSTFRAMLRGSHERRAWLGSLPERVDRQCRAWNLSLDGDPWHGSNALVLPVRRGGEQFALRLTAPDESFPAEVAALRFWAGKPSDRCPHRNSAQCLERRCCSSSRFAAHAVLGHQAGCIS